MLTVVAVCGYCCVRCLVLGVCWVFVVRCDSWSCVYVLRIAVVL